MNSSIVMPSVFPVTCHTDFVGQDSVFVAIEGYADNGVNYIATAIENGARTIVVHHNCLLDDQLHAIIQKYNVTIERVENTRKALALLSAQAAQFPAQNLKIIGITGTKGKTTTSFILEHLLHTARHKTALISSAKNRICGNDFPSPLTTPQPDYLQQFLKVAVDNGVEYVIMEVAAQALTLHRVEGITFCGVIFTN
ncbi:MAG TPA: Mur ligase family protein, partial [Candidatus Babeliales bacterium]|nr:Mur ligase family protein [Candidatus Babeliales bacterium]